jgi:hypothetical protein
MHLWADSPNESDALPQIAFLCNRHYTWAKRYLASLSTFIVLRTYPLHILRFAEKLYLRTSCLTCEINALLNRIAGPCEICDELEAALRQSREHLNPIAALNGITSNDDKQ